jgi:hypothetical protein
MARGRDAADTAISNNFGSTQLVKFAVVCEPEAALAFDHGIADARLAQVG